MGDACVIWTLQYLYVRGQILITNKRPLSSGVKEISQTSQLCTIYHKIAGRVALIQIIQCYPKQKKNDTH